MTGDFPGEERFGLTNQMRCAAVSISSKIDVGSGDGLLVASIADADFRLVAGYELDLAAARKRDVAVGKLKRGWAL